MEQLYFYGTSPFYTQGMYENFVFIDKDETEEERSQRVITNIIAVIVCYIGFPILMAICYGIYKLIA
jgi:hypothetical protein